jgi:hypothetical protein
MEHYFAERSRFFNAWSTFSYPDSCERMGCKEPYLHISINLVDLVAISLISGRKAAELFREYVKIGFDPIHESEPWSGRISLELKKTMPFSRWKEMFRLYGEANSLCSLSGILLHRGESRTYSSEKHIPELSMYPKTLYYFSGQKGRAPTA